jgi:hypothetical protein
MSNYKTFTLGPDLTVTDDDLIFNLAAVTMPTLALDATSGPNAAEFVTLESAGDLSLITFTITGTTDKGVVISESITGPNIEIVTTVNLYLTVTEIATTAASASTIKVGWLYSGTTPAYPVNFRQSPFNISASVELLSGDGTASIQYTFDDPAEEGLARNAFIGTAHWRALPDISGVIDSGSDGSWKFVFIQGQNS